MINRQAKMLKRIVNIFLMIDLRMAFTIDLSVQVLLECLYPVWEE